ncbi:retrotransposon protein, putative, ty1-copia subclass [Tanacetum coccineum]
MTTSVVNNSVFRGFFEKQKLTRPNFIDWYRQLRILLSVEDNLNYLEHPIPATPVPAQAGQQVAPKALAAHAAWRAAVEAIGSYHLSLPSGLVIVLNNCHYNPSITRRIILVSCLYDDGYVNQFVDNSIQVSRNNMVYFSAVPQVGIFEIDLSDSYTNVNSIYTLSNKRSKSNFDSALLWHCRLGHISKKRIEKLQHDRLLNSTDLKAFENAFLDYALETAAHILNMVPTKKGTCKRMILFTKPDKLEPRYIKTHHPTDHMCLYIDAEEHELGDLGEPANYKAALLDSESDN